MAEQPPQRSSAPPEQPPPPAVTAAQVAALAVILNGTGSDESILTALVARLVRMGFRRAVAQAAAGITVRTRTMYPTIPASSGPARVANVRREPVYDAWFVANAAKRITDRVNAGKTPEDAVRPERTFVEQRERARRARRRAADAVDRVADDPQALTVDGRPVLGWAASPDDRTTWECVAADGRWFYADKPPVIGYPGMPHGGTCRCTPVPATPLMLTGDTVDQAVASAQGTATADHEAERFPSPVPDREAEAS